MNRTQKLRHKRMEEIKDLKDYIEVLKESLSTLRTQKEKNAVLKEIQSLKSLLNEMLTKHEDK